MPRCSHEIPFECKCTKCFEEAMGREAARRATPVMPTYPVEIALRKNVVVVDVETSVPQEAQ